jgi:hypothetical protein
MKLRSVLFVFASLLIVGRLAGAVDQTSIPADPSDPYLKAIFAAQPSPGCENAKLPSFEPAPTEAAFICGSCSDPVCVGAERGTICGFQNGQTYRCQPAIYVCSAKDCQCWTGPLP